MGYLVLVAVAVILLKLADRKIRRLESEIQVSAATAKAVLELKEEDIRTKNLELGLKDQEIRKLKKGYEKE